MANNGEFPGNRLRLAAFLRVLQHVPDPPRRCRRRVPIRDDHVEPETCAHRQAAPEPANNETVPVSWEETVFTEHFGGGRQTDVSDPRPNRKKPITYSSTAPKEDPRKPDPSSTARKRHLHVNELAMVLTTAEDDLPDRSAEETVSLLPTTDLDPIEDDGMAFSFHVSQHVLPNSSANLNIYPPVSRVSPPGATVCSRQANKRKTKRNEKQNRSNLHARSLPTYKDAFVESELSIPSKPKLRKGVAKVVKRQLKRRVPKITGCLALRSGYLPEPHPEDEITQASLQLARMTTNPVPMQRWQAERQSRRPSPAHEPLECTSPRANEDQLVHAPSPVDVQMSDEQLVDRDLSHAAAPFRAHSDTATEIITDDEELIARTQNNDSYMSANNSAGDNTQRSTSQDHDAINASLHLQNHGHRPVSSKQNPASSPRLQNSAHQSISPERPSKSAYFLSPQTLHKRTPLQPTAANRPSHTQDTLFCLSNRSIKTKATASSSPRHGFDQPTSSRSPANENVHAKHYHRESDTGDPTFWSHYGGLE